MNKPLVGWIGLLGPVYAITAFSEVYMTEQKSVEVLFPAEKFEKIAVELTSEELKKIQAQSKVNVHSTHLSVYKSSSGDAIYIDQVLGKHEYITYAVGIKKDGAVKGIEILEYRESYGHQVRTENWRKQFVDKTTESALNLDQDIKNISGATLSSAHVTDGVKRILHTHAIIRSRI
jgi:Na+-translocating ferredoxin:NAD+ oxidoreductase RnfG subunit